MTMGYPLAANLRKLPLHMQDRPSMFSGLPVEINDKAGMEKHFQGRSPHGLRKSTGQFENMAHCCVLRPVIRSPYSGFCHRR